MVTVLIAHNRKLFRQALVSSLSMQPDISVIADVPDGIQLDKKSSQLTPDVILVDSILPLKSAKLLGIVDKFSPPGMVVVPSDDHADSLSGPMAPLRCVPYDADLGELVCAIKVAARDRIAEFKRPNGHLGHLTGRELEILNLIAAGLSNKQIGRRLRITERTVKYHVSNILRKLDAASRTEAAIAYVSRKA